MSKIVEININIGNDTYENLILSGNSVTYHNSLANMSIATFSDSITTYADSDLETSDMNWQEANLPSSASWRSVVYGNGKFVAVAYSNSNKAVYSTDGVSWQEATLPFSAYWQSVTYGNGKFVAVVYSGNKAAYSEDGITWTTVTLPSSASWGSVTYGNGKFVAVAGNNSNKAAYSEDGITWTAATLPSSVSWSSVTYGNGKFVAVAASSNKAAYSEDGITWTAATLSSSAIWQSVTYGNGKFVAIVYGSNKAAYSEDGITWTAATLPSSANWYEISYGNGKFVAVATSNSNKAVYSTDGVSWQEATLPFSASWQSVTYGNGKFVAVAASSNKIAYSEQVESPSIDNPTTGLTATTIQEAIDELYAFVNNGKITYTVSVIINPEGYGTVLGEGDYGYGETVTLTAVPIDGYKFVVWQEQKPSGLPDKYTELEYITLGVGTSILTDVSITTDTTRVLIDIEPTEKITTYTAYILGAYNPYVGGTSFTLSTTSNTMYWNAGYIYVNGSTGYVNSGEFSYDLKKDSRIVIDFDTPNKQIKMNENSFTISTVSNNDGTKMRFGGSPTLFSSTNGSQPMKIYSAQIYVDGELKGSFIPCKNESGKIGLYNIETGYFCENNSNASPSEPTAGPESNSSSSIVDISDNEEYSFTIENDRMLTAIFSKIVPTYTVSVTVDPVGSGTVSGAGTYEEGESVNLVATPENGYDFVAWKKNEKSRLPNGYTELEYIESSGTQYINTEFKPNEESRIILDIDIESGTQNTSPIFGSRASSNNPAFCLWAINNETLRTDYGADQISISKSIIGRHLIDKNKNITIIDSDVYESTSSNFQIDFNLFLFNINTAGNTRGEKLFAKLYFCRIYDNEELIHDFVPCKNASNEIGLYDLVTNEFYSNAGTGTFIAGSEFGETNNIVSENAEYSFIIDENRELVAVFEEKNTSRLPEGYTELEYISNPNKAFIVNPGIGYLPFSGTRLEFVINIPETATGYGVFGNNFFYNVKSGSNYTNRSNGYYLVYTPSTKKLTVIYGYSSSSTNGYARAELESETGLMTIVIDCPKSLFKVNEQEAILSNSNQVTNSTSLLPVALFAYSYYAQSKPTSSGSITTTNKQGSSPLEMDLYSFKMYNSTSDSTGDLIHDYVPCINPDGDVGIYDMVTNNFYKNYESGKVFVAGPSV